jgi:DNA invertase Pin-like site-specific DNA recombinase
MALPLAHELIVENTREGLTAARAHGRVGGRKPKLSAGQVRLARQLYGEKGPDGRRGRPVAQIAAMLGVSRTTIYRHLEAADGQPAGC